jgi:hypothetical protein
LATITQFSLFARSKAIFSNAIVSPSSGTIYYQGEKNAKQPFEPFLLLPFTSKDSVAIITEVSLWFSSKEPESE